MQVMKKIIVNTYNTRVFLGAKDPKNSSWNVELRVEKKEMQIIVIYYKFTFYY